MSTFEAAHKGHLLSDLETEGSANLGVGAEPAPKGPFGRTLVDALTPTVGNRLRAISPLLGDPFDDGAYLRLILGNAYFILPILGFVLGIVTLVQTGGMALPPATPIAIGLMALGLLDAFTGLVAWVVVLLGVVLSGHFFSLHVLHAPVGQQGMLYVYSSLFTLGLLWFIGPQLPRKMRPVSVARPQSGFSHLYATVSDYSVIPFLGVLILGSLPALLPMMTGAASQGLTQVVLQNYLVQTKWVVAGALIVRVFLERWTFSRYAHIALTVPVERATWVKRFTKASSALLALLLIWEVMGTMWQTYVVWLSFVFTEQLVEIGERFMKPSELYRFLPRNLFKIFVMVLFAQTATKYLNGILVSGSQILGWLAIALTVVTMLFGILEAATIEGEEESTWPDWAVRVGGTLSVALLFIFTQNVYGIEAKPYAGPNGVSVTPSGVVFVADSGNDRVVRIGTDGNRTTVGSNLSRPFAATLDPSSAREIVLIADTGHNRVLAVNTQAQAAALPPRFGISLAAPASSQRAIGSGFQSPTSVAATVAGNVYVADSGHNRVVLVTKSGVQSTVLSGLSDPRAVFVDPFGNLWVADTGHGRIIKASLQTDGTVKSAKIFETGLSVPAGVAVDATGNVFVANTGRNSIIETRTDGSRREVPGEFFNPGQLSVNSSGHVYVTNVGSSEIKVITPLYSGRTYAKATSDLGAAMAVAKDGSIYVVSARGGTLERIIKHTTSVVTRNLVNPNGVAISAINRLYVSQTGLGEIDEVNSAGALTKLTGGLPGVNAIAPDSYGGLVAVSSTEGKLWAITAQGVVTTLVSHLDHPDGVAFDAYGYIEIALAGHGGATGGVIRIIPGQAASSIAQGLNAVTSITTDHFGNIFYLEAKTNRLWENMGPLGTQLVSEGFEGGATPTSIASDPEGNLFVLTQHPNKVLQYQPGYQVNPL
jgi:sugar lactone lactonase YvrE